MMPCDITIEASNDRIIWDQVGNYSESRDLDPGLRWAARCKGNATFTLMFELALKNAEPCYLSVDLLLIGMLVASVIAGKAQDSYKITGNVTGLPDRQPVASFMLENAEYAVMGKDAVTGGGKAQEAWMKFDAINFDLVRERQVLEAQYVQAEQQGNKKQMQKIDSAFLFVYFLLDTECT